MKHICAIPIILLAVMFLLCGCSKTSVEKNADITLTFIYENKNISVTLEADEAEKVVGILDGKYYNGRFSGIPSCGFNKNISLKIGNCVFAIACDTCNYIQDLDHQRYFEIPMEDMDYIRTLFEKYGGYFPCL